jgi:hypothetical protein
LTSFRNIWMNFNFQNWFFLKNFFLFVYQNETFLTYEKFKILISFA